VTNVAASVAGRYAGTRVIGAPPAVVNAVADALSPFGVTITRLPLGPSQIIALLQEGAA
jgi:carbon-monoxide dehydrogenase large subunit